MRADIILTLPCPLCQPACMLTSTWEPQEHAPGDLPYLVSVEGCAHADLAMDEYEGISPKRPAASTGGIVWAPIAFWRALFHEIENWVRDQYTDALEARMDHHRTLRGEP